MNTTGELGQLWPSADDEPEHKVTVSSIIQGGPAERAACVFM